MWVGLTCYALFAGADFGAGVWDLLAGSAGRGARRRQVIEHAIGPVWEANHVWLIFVIVMLWACFSPVFAAVMSTLYVPLTLAALGIIARGAAFAFRKASTELWQQRLFGAFFAVSSLVTPFFLGAVAGGVASGRVPAGLAEGDVLTSWLNPTSVLGGVLAVLACAHLAAVYLCADAARDGDAELARGFARRAVVTGLASGAVALAGTAVLHADAPELFHGLTHRALPLVLLSAVSGVTGLGRVVKFPPSARRARSAASGACSGGPPCSESLGECRILTLVLDVLGSGSGAARVRAWRRGAGGNLTTRPRTAGDAPLPRGACGGRAGGRRDPVVLGRRPVPGHARREPHGRPGRLPAGRALRLPDLPGLRGRPVGPGPLAALRHLPTRGRLQARPPARALSGRAPTRRHEPRPGSPRTAARPATTAAATGRLPHRLTSTSTRCRTQCTGCRP
ncbi:cytochrome D ubiquinol oxidase, subunit II [Streptomyces sp. e14]|nr:cytochrome D ubiquinol oxidase, subunit II [Streptomyces sp. e14]